MKAYCFFSCVFYDSQAPTRLLFNWCAWERTPRVHVCTCSSAHARTQTRSARQPSATARQRCWCWDGTRRVRQTAAQPWPWPWWRCSGSSTSSRNLSTSSTSRSSSSSSRRAHPCRPAHACQPTRCQRVQQRACQPGTLRQLLMMTMLLPLPLPLVLPLAQRTTCWVTQPYWPPPLLPLSKPRRGRWQTPLAAWTQQRRRCTHTWARCCPRPRRSNSSSSSRRLGGPKAMK